MMRWKSGRGTLRSRSGTTGRLTNSESSSCMADPCDAPIRSMIRGQLEWSGSGRTIGAGQNRVTLGNPHRHRVAANREKGDPQAILVGLARWFFPGFGCFQLDFPGGVAGKAGKAGLLGAVPLNLGGVHFGAGGVLILDLMLGGAGSAQSSAGKWIRVIRHRGRPVPVISRSARTMAPTLVVPCSGRFAPSQLITMCLSRERMNRV